MSDRHIVSCAERMTKRTRTTYNGEFLPEIKKEIARMKHHCNKSIIAELELTSKRLAVAEALLESENLTEKFEEILRNM